MSADEAVTPGLSSSPKRTDDESKLDLGMAGLRVVVEGVAKKGLLSVCKATNRGFCRYSDPVLDVHEGCCRVVVVVLGVVVAVVDRLVVNDERLAVLVVVVVGRLVPSVGWCFLSLFNLMGLNMLSSTSRVRVFFSHSRVWTCSRAGTSLFQKAHVSWSLLSSSRTTLRLSSNSRMFLDEAVNCGHPTAAFPLPLPPAG